ncbi:b(0,+)-type amino acid transporter 1-like [Ylistrum balloti]|uniref:b(0,+)-type amino acid transporter 1-like n=1 Tax=Ylistrum balloti TaxID=509963 RepID=UPI002905EF82|nr:b(0,+)-type amino acid transporter 1-like [Ylistrum balloti]
MGYISDNTVSSAVKRETVGMKKNLGLVSAVSFAVNAIIGSGIFFSPTGVLFETGSVGLSLLVWVLAGLLALIGSMCYCELGCLIPKSGSEYPYLLAGLGKIIAFLFAWTQSIVLTPTLIAVSILIFAEYTVILFDFCGTSQTLIKIIAVLIMIALAIINCWDTKHSAGLQVCSSAVKLVVLGVIIVGGFVLLGQGETATMQKGFSGNTNSASSIALAFYNATWAYGGWNRINCVTEELKNPKRNLPRASILGVIIAIIVYFLANISYLTVLGIEGVMQSRVVAFTWGETVLGPGGMLMTIAVLLSILGTANADLFGGSRILYAAAREHQFPEVLSYVSCKRCTPIPCIIFTTLLTVLLTVLGDIRSLINFFSFTAWLFHGLTVFALLVLRFTMKDTYRPIKIFILFPLIFIVCSMYLVVAPIIQNPTVEFLYAFLFMSGGLVFYVPFVHYHADQGFFKHVTRFVQCLMEVVPSPYKHAD